MPDARSSVYELTWGTFGRCVTCMKHPAVGPLGYCGVCHWLVVAELTSGWEAFWAELDDVLAAGGGKDAPDA